MGYNKFMRRRVLRARRLFCFRRKTDSFAFGIERNDPMNRWITKTAIVLAVCLSFSGCSMLEDGASSSAESSQVSSVSSQPEEQEGVIKQSVLMIS